MSPFRKPKFSRVLIVALLSLGLHFAALGQTVLGNDDVVKMVTLGIAPSVIITKIKNTPCDYDTSINALADLTKKGVPESVISAMIEGCDEDSGERVAPMPAVDTLKSLTLEGSPGSGYCAGRRRSRRAVHARSSADDR